MVRRYVHKRALAVLALVVALSFMTVGCLSQRDCDCGPDKGTLVLMDFNLQEQIDRTADGATLRLPPGLYRMPTGVLIEDRQDLVITSDGNAYVEVDDLYSHVITIIDSTAIRLENLHLKHRQPLGTYACHGSVVQVDNSENVTVTRCELNGSGAIGLAGWSVRQLTVEECHIHHNSFNAIYLQGCDGITLRHNLIEDNASLMQVYQANDLRMEFNVIRRNGGAQSATSTPTKAIP